MKNFTRLIPFGLVLISAQAAVAEEITDKDWILQQGNEYIREAVINLELPLAANLERLKQPASAQKRSDMLAKSDTKALTPKNTSASE
ncbi:hypothetical protein [Lacimicrobium sp. SS2-24]|uniref:hypothetical protein n=1 Tax=Lacimicrobium sp. SS2-24 TaxID=2005569 RepID=UPI000B4A6176|nr:hypothetical protein [Lacimicrobium sp. SS2-24]